MSHRTLATSACLFAALLATTFAPGLGHATVFRDGTTDHMPESTQARLVELHDRLNLRKVEVDAALKEFDGPPSTTPRLTALRALSLSGVAPDTNFITDLREADGLLLAVKSNAPRGYDETGPILFLQEWIGADPGDRVFLS